MTTHHHPAPMTARDPGEHHRTATPLELLFDLTFVVAFSTAASQTSEQLLAGHPTVAWTGFGFAVFATAWAWINYAWLASAYDNEDVVFRLATLVEMAGVIILSLGIPQLFASLGTGGALDFGVMTAGYVVMRVAAVGLWLRAAADDPGGRRACLTYAATITAAQIGWVALIALPLSAAWSLGLAVLLIGIELLGPVLAEREGGGTPWHPDHLAERYSLLILVTLGEVILGTVHAVAAVIDTAGWSVEAALTVFGGTTLAFGLWWLYFAIPSAPLLGRHRGRAVVWGIGHIPAYGALVAAGVGLQVAAETIHGDGTTDPLDAIMAVAVPVAAFEVTLLVIHTLLLRRFEGLQLLLVLGGVLVLASAVGAIALGIGVGAALFIVAAAPALFVAVHEAAGYRREARLVRSATR